MRRCRCGRPDSPCDAGSLLGGPGRCRAEGHPLSGFKLGNRGPERRRTHLTLSTRPQELRAFLPGESHRPLLISVPARDAASTQRGQVGAEAGLRGRTGQPAPGRRKLYTASVARPGIPHPGTSSSSRGRYSRHSGTNTLTCHGWGQAARAQRLPEWEPGHLGEAAGGRGLGRGSEPRERLVLRWAELRSEGGGRKCGAEVQAAVRQERGSRPGGVGRDTQGFGEEGAVWAQGAGQRG